MYCWYCMVPRFNLFAIYLVASDSISKNHFQPGRMAPSESMWSVTAIRNTSVGEYSAQGVNSPRCVPYRPLIAAHCFFSFCRSPILNDHSSVVANCDHTSEWIHGVCACIGIAMQWVTMPKSLFPFLLPASKMQFTLY